MGRISTAIAANKKNNVINGAFDIWQRGTSISVPTNTITYSADRWAAYSLDSICTVSRQTATAGIQGFGLKLQRDSGQTGTNACFVSQSAESTNSVALGGKTFTLTFRAKAGANFSASGLTMTSRISTGTGTDQNRINGFTGQVDLSQANTLTTSFQTFQHTVTLASNINQFAVLFFFIPVGTAGADDSVTIEQVMLTEGSTSPMFSRFAEDIEGEIDVCERYFQKSYLVNVAPGTVTAAGSMEFKGNPSSTAIAQTMVPVYFRTRMRTAPTITTYSPTTGASGNWHSVDAAADVLFAQSGTTGDTGFTGTNSAAYGGVNQRSRGHWTAAAEL